MHNTPEQVLASLNADPRALFHAAQNEAFRFELRPHDLQVPRPHELSEMIGSQKFSALAPPALLRYFELAAILHVGKFGHYGCGIFGLN